MISRNPNKRNYARSIFCALIFGVIVSIVLGGAIFVLTYLGIAPDLVEELVNIETLV